MNDKGDIWNFLTVWWVWKMTFFCSGPLVTYSPDFLLGANGEPYRTADWFWTVPSCLCAHVLQLVLIPRSDLDIFIWNHDSLLFLSIDWSINAWGIISTTVNHIYFMTSLSSGRTLQQLRQCIANMKKMLWTYQGKVSPLQDLQGLIINL